MSREQFGREFVRCMRFVIQKPRAVVSPRDTLCRRIFTRVVIAAGTGCWNYMGNRRSGYGMISQKQRTLSVHRLTWEMWNGAIPDGFELHHTCENAACCNPSHLALVRPREHLVELTPSSVAYRNARKTHCLKGHALVPGNLEPVCLRSGGRKCLICHRESNRKAMQRLRDRRAAQ